MMMMMMMMMMQQQHIIIIIIIIIIIYQFIDTQNQSSLVFISMYNHEKQNMTCEFIPILTSNTTSNIKTTRK